MYSSRPSSSRVAKKVAVVLVVALVGTVLTLIAAAGGTALHAQSSATLESTIFSWDGTDFVRTHTTLMTEDGKSAVGTKLDHASAAYKPLTEKHSWQGKTKLFGKSYDSYYAPLTDNDGKLTGAIFVATAAM